MDEIVKKLQTRTAPAATGGVPGSLQPRQDRELRVVIDAESAGGMKKRAVVTLEEQARCHRASKAPINGGSWLEYGVHRASTAACGENVGPPARSPHLHTDTPPGGLD